VWLDWTVSPGAPFSGAALTTERLGALRQRLQDHGREQLLALGQWLRSTDQRAVFLRERADPLTPLRPQKCEEYLDRLRVGSQPTARVTGWRPEPHRRAAEAQLWRLVLERGRTDPPRRRLLEGGWETRWTWPTPEGCPAPERWQRAAAEALESVGGWSRVAGASDRDRPHLAAQWSGALITHYQQEPA
jgi:hypothetical protein